MLIIDKVSKGWKIFVTLLNDKFNKLGRFLLLSDRNSDVSEGQNICFFVTLLSDKVSKPGRFLSP